VRAAKAGVRVHEECRAAFRHGIITRAAVEHCLRRWIIKKHPLVAAASSESQATSRVHFVRDYKLLLRRRFKHSQSLPPNVGVEISEIFKASDRPTRQRGAHQTLNLCIYFPSHKRVGSLHELLEKQTLLSHPHNQFLEKK
jgi:hypothetical protein